MENLPNWEVPYRSKYMADCVGPAQSPATCQFCEESEEIKWLCFHCDLCLCQICNRRIHSKQKTSQGHKVIALTDLDPEEAAETRRRVDLENLTCKDHQGQKLISFCLDCHVTLCQICYEAHQNHNKNELQKFYDEKLAEIHTVKQAFDEYLSPIKIEETKLTKMREDKYNEYKKVKGDIEKREADVIAEAKRYSQKLHSKIDQVYQPILTDIENNLLEIRQTEKEATEKRDMVTNILYSEKASDVLDSSRLLKHVSAPQVPQQSVDLPSAKSFFTPGLTVHSKIGEIFGDVYKTEPKLVNTYKTTLSNIASIVGWNKNEKVIASYWWDTLQRFNNGSMTIVKDKGIHVNDMAPMKNGDILISLDKELVIYTKTGTFKPYKSFPFPLRTLGVHVNEQNEVLVGLTESIFLPVKPDNITKVVVFNQLGNEQRAYQYIRDSKQRLFTSPERIITCQDKICVIDILNASWDILNGSWEGRLVALNNEGHVQWTYIWEGDRFNSTFYPGGIAVTTTDQILVTDLNNHAIHVLNAIGQPMFCHQVKDLGVERPRSLCMDNEGLLWVGSSKGGFENDKIHVLQGIALKLM